MQAITRRRSARWGKMGVTSPRDARRAVRAGVVLAVAAVATLAAYFIRVGLDEADKLGSAIGAMVGVTGLALAGTAPSPTAP